MLKVVYTKLLNWSHIFHIEPQWRFETKLPGTLEGDENDKIELECSVQDEDAECDWYFAGDVSWIFQLNSTFFSSRFFSIENFSGIKSWEIWSYIIWKSSKISC